VSEAKLVCRQPTHCANQGRRRQFGHATRRRKRVKPRCPVHLGALLTEASHTPVVRSLERLAKSKPQYAIQRAESREQRRRQRHRATSPRRLGHQRGRGRGRGGRGDKQTGNGNRGPMGEGRREPNDSNRNPKLAQAAQPAACGLWPASAPCLCIPAYICGVCPQPWPAMLLWPPAASCLLCLLRLPYGIVASCPLP
jgi:hypothetical protein